MGSERQREALGSEPQEVGSVQSAEAGDGGPRPPRPFRLLLRIPVPWAFVLTYLAGIPLDRFLLPEANRNAFPWIGIAGAVVFIIGVIVAGWGWLTFRRADTTTVPGERSARLVTWGPYRFTRNPMYVGLALGYLGEAGILRQVGPVLLLPCVVAYVNWVVIPLEEHRLREVFGARYDDYRARVRRWV